MTVTEPTKDAFTPSDILPWLVEMGADEVLLDEPIDRFAASAVPAAPPRELPAAPAKPSPSWKAVATGAEGIAAAESLAASITTVQDCIEAISRFDGHPLKKTASRTCVVQGNLNSAVLILCDKPRNDEDRSGEVLAGSSSVLAGRMLAAIGLSFDAVTLANFIPWRPPGNRAPTDQEALMLVPLARRLVGMLQPKAILCFGHLPCQYLAGGEDAIMKARGKWIDIDGIPALTTFHPETLLKSPASKRMAWQDLQSFRKRLTDLS
jgi:uracil-DNA glycosylase